MLVYLRHMSSRSERRTVHPVITQAIVDGLDRADLHSPSVDAARAALGAGHPVDERLHRSLKRFLFTHGGPQASFDTGRQFAVSTEHPLLALLARSRSPSELIHRARRLEPLLHLGNRTRIVTSDAELGVVHTGNRGINPTTGESLFVCGAQCGMLERIGATDLEVSISDEHGKHADIWPRRHPFLSGWSIPEPCNAWTIRWKSAPSHAPIPTTGVLAEDIRARITDQPEQPWTVSDVAAAFALSPRSLQRGLQQQHTELRHLVRAGRADAARALLTRTDVPVSVVAYLCGFADAAHLANVTRSLYGATPTAIRAGATAA